MDNSIETKNNVVNGSLNDAFEIVDSYYNTFEGNKALSANADGFKISTSSYNTFLNTISNLNGWRGIEIISGTGNIFTNAITMGNNLLGILDTGTDTKVSLSWNDTSWIS